jgi:hypothetical protein
MRKLLLAATMLTAFGFAGTAALADSYNGHGTGGYGNSHNDDSYNSNDDNGGQGGEQGYGQGAGERGYNDRDEDRGDRDWQRSWQGRDNYNGHGQVLPYWKLERRIERQGYFDVRNLHQSHWGFGWKAFARDHYGRSVALRVNPYSGRVLDVRVLYRR